MHIITGPNGAGKSIFIRQVLLIQIMAQIGCYVPAETAVFRPADRMFARIYMNDDMEWGASTFVLEMKEIQHIFETMTDNSLIIIDELCRSTAVEQGTSVAMGICEKFAQTAAFIYVTTHYTLLTKLRDICLNVQIWQMETIASGDDPKTFNLDYKYVLVPGILSIKDYGIYLVRNVWPDKVMKHIEEVLEDLRRNETPQDPKFVPIDKKMRLKYTLESNLRHLKDQKKLSIFELNKHLNEYRHQLEALKFSEQDSLNPDLMNLHDLSIASINHGVFDASFNNDYYNAERTQFTAAVDPEFNRTPNMVSHPQNCSDQYENGNFVSAEDSKWIPEIHLSYSSQSSSHLAANHYQLFGVSPNYSYAQELNVSQMSDSALSWHMELARNNQSQPSINPEDVTILFNTSSSSSKNNFEAEPHCNYSMLASSADPRATPNFSKNGLDVLAPFNYPVLARNVVSRSTSEISENMNAFSLPLRQSVSKTSTPITKVYPNQQNESSTPTEQNVLASKSVGEVQSEQEYNIQEELSIYVRSLQEDGEDVFDVDNTVGHDVTQQTPIDHTVIDDDTSQCVIRKTETQMSCPNESYFSEYEATGSYDVSPLNCSDKIENKTPLFNGEESRKDMTISSINSEDRRLKIHPLSPIVIVKVPANIDYSVDDYETCSQFLQLNNACENTAVEVSKDFEATSENKLDEKVYLKTPLEIQENSVTLQDENESSNEIIELDNDSNLADVDRSKQNLKCLSMNVSGFTQESQEDIFKASTPSISYSPPNISQIDLFESFNNSVNETLKSITGLCANEDVDLSDTLQNLPEQGVDCSKDDLQGGSGLFRELGDNVMNEEVKKEEAICVNHNIVVESTVETYPKTEQVDKNHKKPANDIVVESTVETYAMTEQIDENHKKPANEVQENLNLKKSEQHSVRSSDDFHSCSDTSQNEFDLPKKLNVTERNNLLRKYSNCAKLSSTRTDRSKVVSKSSNSKVDISRRPKRRPVKSCIEPLNDDKQNEKIEDKKKMSIKRKTTTSGHHRIETPLEIKEKDNIDKSRKNSTDEKTTITSISEASRKRNLDRAESTTSSHRTTDRLETLLGNNQKEGNAEKTTTSSISEASRKRNLDHAATTTSSAHGSSNSDSNNKDMDNHSASLKLSSLKESDGDEPKCKKEKKVLVMRSVNSKVMKKAQKKFIPPLRKLTRKEIKEEFLAQDRKILEMAGSSTSSDQNLRKMYEHRLNRPTVKQIQSSTDLVTIRRTNAGVQVIPAPKEVVRRRRQSSVGLTRKISSHGGVNISIFSDKNSKVFDEFISSGKKDYTLFNFNFSKDKPAEQNNKSGNMFNFQPLKDATLGEFTTNSVSASFVRTQSHQSQELLSFLTPIGSDTYMFN